MSSLVNVSTASGTNKLRGAAHWFVKNSAFDAANFFNNKNETRTDKLTCPRCRRENEYPMRWVVRTKKDRLPHGADERDRALYAKLRDYMIRVDDSVTCKTCGKKFEIPSQQSLLFVDQFAGLPNDEELEREIAAAQSERRKMRRSLSGVDRAVGQLDLRQRKDRRLLTAPRKG